MVESAGIRRIGQIAIPVREPARAATFYRDVLGLRHLFDAPPSMSFFECGGVRLMLAVPEETSAEAGMILYFDVEDIGAAHGVLAGRGVRVEREPHRIADLGDRELWLSFYHDSESNLFALMSEVAKRA